MRVKIERGQSTIEVEGDFAEVEQVLKQFWSVGRDHRDQHESSPAATEDDTSKARKPAKRRAASNATSSAQSGDADIQGIVNRIKDDARHDAFRQKIILGNASVAERAKFASWFEHPNPLTSGTIRKVLDGLGIKITLPSVSNALAGPAKNDYMVEGPQFRPKYRLTERAHAAFEKWLLDGNA